MMIISTMRSSLALLVFIGCVFFPQAALGVVVPVYYYRAPPTSSPSSSPSYSHKPSSRPTSHPTSSPSLSPSSQPSSHPTSNPTISLSSEPSLFVQPTSQPSSNPSSSSYLRTSNNLVVNSDRNSMPSFGIGLITALVVILLFVGHGIRSVYKSKRRCRPCGDGNGDGNGDELSQDNSDGTTAAKTDTAAPTKKTHAENDLQPSYATSFFQHGINMGYALQTRIEHAIDTFTTQNRHVQFANKKKVQVFHREEEPGMVSFDSCFDNNDNKEADRTKPPILRSSSFSNDITDNKEADRIKAPQHRSCDHPALVIFHSHGKHAAQLSFQQLSALDGRETVVEIFFNSNVRVGDEFLITNTILLRLGNLQGLR